MGIFVRKRICNLSFLAAVAATFAVVSSGAASALTYENIAGSWCTGTGIAQFDRNNMTIVLSSTGRRAVYPIVGYEFQDAAIIVSWKKTANGEVTKTIYGEFDSAGRGMVQQISEDGPRRELHRC
jgi:hypothetical protein